MVSAFPCAMTRETHAEIIANRLSITDSAPSNDLGVTIERCWRVSPRNVITGGDFGIVIADLNTNVDIQGNRISKASDWRGLLFA